MSVAALQIIGGLASFVATALAWWVSAARLDAGRTHFISEVLAVAWWQPAGEPRRPGYWGSLVASLLLGVGALAFSLAAAIELSNGWDLGAVGAAATGALLLGVILFPLRSVPTEHLRTARGLDLVHPTLAALFYVVALATAVIIASHAGQLGTILATLHVASSTVLTVAVQVLARRALGPAAYQPCYLPGVRILLDRRPASESPTEWVRRLQWPATLLVAIDLGFAAAGR